MDNSRDIVTRAKAVLRENDAGNFTKPGLKQYPHQWNWDSALIALGLSHFDLPRALLEIRSLLSGQWQDGMLPHVVYHSVPSDYFPNASFWGTQSSPHGPTEATSGITQPPLLATILRTIHSRTPIVDFLREIYPKLLGWHRWLHTARDADRSGAVCILHPWESGTDDSPRWLEVLEGITPGEIPAFQRGDMKYVSPSERPHQTDYARFIYLIDEFKRHAYQPGALLEHSPFLVQDVLFNSILQRADKDLSALARELGEPADELDGWIARMQTAFDRQFWDEQARLYLDFDVRRGASIRVNTAATFMPLFGGIASPEQAQRLVEGHLLNPLEYAPGAHLRYWVTTTSRSEPAWEARRYWRGPVWIIMNWFLSEGLRAYHYHDLAQAIVEDSLELMEGSGFREYYDPLDGAGCGSEQFSWSAALAIEMQRAPTQGEDRI